MAVQVMREFASNQLASRGKDLARGAASQLMKATMFESGVEQVSIEAVGVGDFVFTNHPAPGVGARCVLAKHAKTNERTERIVGWLVELNGGSLAWWPHGATVWRRR